VVEATKEDLVMTWLITGSSGQLGLAMQSELIARNIKFLALTSKDLDITDLEAVNESMTEKAPTVVVNCAAWTDVDAAETNKEIAFAVNALGPRNLAVASKSIGAVLVHISTDYVFSGESDTPWQEDEVRNPASVYGLSKRDGELFIENLYPEGSYIIRTAWLYSPNGRNFAKTMAKLALSDAQEVKVVSDQSGQPTSAKNLAKQIVDLVAAKKDFGIYHGTNSGTATWFSFAQEIFALAGKEVSRLVPVLTSEFPRLAKRPRYSVLGHANWKKSGLEEMPQWKSELANEFPAILHQIEKEEV
jgi:dTDP-4-dehydrorhamnose reductase